MTNRIVRTEEEINQVLNAAAEAEEDGVSAWPGMTYEMGVRAALRWLLGETDEHPLEDG